MYLLIGLGNKGEKYTKTRHNFGFLTIDQLVKDYDLKEEGEKFSSQVFKGEIKGKKIIALKPQTFMNNSGIAALEAMQFYKIKIENIIVFHDEVDLEIGRIKVKIGGGSAGHNGLKSLDEKIGKDYLRVRLGISRPQNPEFEVADYVLSKFSKEEFQTVEKINKKISDLITDLLDNKTDLFVNNFYLEK